MKILSQYDSLIYYIDFKDFLKDFKDKNITLFNTSTRIKTKHISELFKDFKYNDEYIFIHIGFEMHSAKDADQQIINELFKKDIDLDKCYVITNNPGYAKDSHLKTIHFEYFEYAMQRYNINIDVNKKRHEKKFLCLNGKPVRHRRDITEFFVDNNLLDVSSYSYNDKDYSIVYDEKFKNMYYDNNNDPLNMKDTFKKTNQNVNLIFDEEFSYQNSIYIITECLFEMETDRYHLSEKTYKAMLLKMPFIMIGPPYSLRHLRSLGYKTFNHMWNEQYDTIIEPSERLNNIKELILNLSKKDLKKLVVDNYDILEYNYNNLITRQPEKELFDTIRSLK